MKYLLTFLFLTSIVACELPERLCEDFKTGTFSFQEFINGELRTTTFIRNDSIEIDYFEDRIDTFSIRWINNCEYVMRSLNPKNLAEERPVHFKIIKTAGNTYTFEYAMVVKKNKASKRYAKQGTATKTSTSTNFSLK